MLETSAIFMVLENSSGVFFGGIFTVLETFSWNFTVLETSLEGFSQCGRLLSRDFHCAADFFGGVFTALETSSGEFRGAGDCFGRIFSAGDFFLDFYGAGDFFGGIFTVLETSSGEFHSAGDFFGGIFHGAGDF